MPHPAPWLCGSLQEGIPDSLCNITDTVCVEPQPKQSNFTDTYTHKIVRSCPISRLRNIDVPLNVSMRATATSSTLVLSRAFSLSTLPDACTLPSRPAMWGGTVLALRPHALRARVILTSGG